MNEAKLKHLINLKFQQQKSPISAPFADPKEVLNFPSPLKDGDENGVSTFSNIVKQQVID